MDSQPLQLATAVMSNKIDSITKQAHHWSIVASEYILKDRWLTLRADTCTIHSGATISPYYVVEGKDSVHAIVLNEKQEVLLTCQYRHGAQTTSFEFPCGKINSGEDKAAALLRELQEETGCLVASARLIGTFYANPARQTNRVHTYICTGARLATTTSWDESEQIGFDFFSTKELMELIQNGQFSQGLHLASWFLALSYMNENSVYPISLPAFSIGGK
jgi:mutator protein MutT